MFHRTVKKVTQPSEAQSKVEPQKQINVAQPYKNRVESSAVERYAKFQPMDEAHQMEQMRANENSNIPNEMPVEISAEIKDFNDNNNFEPPFNNQSQNQVEENNFMNNPEPQKTEDKAGQSMAPQNRDVNIPGNNFKRPAQAPAQPAVAGARPSYPGAYSPNTAANGPYGAQGGSGNGRKLVIGQGITMSGEIESCEHLIVEGTIEATLKGASVLDVYESGAFLGTVEIDEANIAGRFEGDITVKGRLTIEATGQVVGSISYKELSMEAGAVIDGTISPIGSPNAAKNANAKSAPAKSKKASTDNGAQLPFSDKGQAAE